MLLALLSGQRCQTLHCLSVSSMKMSDSKCVFTVYVLLKQSRKGKHLAPLEFLAFPQNEKLCIVSVLNEYLRMTKEIRGEENKLLLSYQVPHKPVSKNTLARWLRQVLNGAGVDIALFSAHSTRATSTSAALSSGVCASGRCATSGRMELGVNIYPVLQKGTSCKYGASPVGFLSPQKLE